MADEGTDLVKVWLDDLHLTNPAKPPLPLLGASVWQAAIVEAHKRHLRVAVHIHDLDLARQALAHGADILAHGVRDKPVDTAFVTQLKNTAHGISLLSHLMNRLIISPNILKHLGREQPMRPCRQRCERL